MKKIFCANYIFIIFLLLPCSNYSQYFVPKDIENYFYSTGKPEIILRIYQPNRDSVNYLTKFISIDKYYKDSITAIISLNEINDPNIIKLLKNYTISYNNINPSNITHNNKENEWSKYFSYSEILNILNYYKTNYPELCEVENFGKTTNNRDLLLLKIRSKNKNDYKPNFLYVASIHGNELAPINLMLRLANYILENYSKSDIIKNLIDSVNLFIVPLMNPDGTFYGGDNYPKLAIRGNANLKDLNRDFPRIEDTLLDDTLNRQKETIAMIKLMQKYRFHNCANIHTGSIVVNYPWDAIETSHADKDWYYSVSRMFADEVFSVSKGTYMSDFDKGTVEGWQWYVIYGGRQDYTNFRMHSREVTIEIDNDYITPEEWLDTLWNYYKQPFINYVKNTLYGVIGKITDSITGLPIENVDIFVQYHDTICSNIFSNKDGFYCRPIYPGNYYFSYSHNNYKTQIHNIITTPNNTIIKNITMLPKEYGKICININDTSNNNAFLDLYVYSNDTLFRKYSIQVNTNTCIPLYFGNYNIILSHNGNSYFIKQLSIYDTNTIIIDTNIVTSNNNYYYYQKNNKIIYYINNNKLFIISNKNIKNNTYIKIYNLFGDNIICSSKIHNNIISIDINNLEKGIYIISIINDEDVINIKSLIY